MREKKNERESGKGKRFFQRVSWEKSWFGKEEVIGLGNPLLKLHSLPRNFLTLLNWKRNPLLLIKIPFINMFVCES